MLIDMQDFVQENHMVSAIVVGCEEDPPRHMLTDMQDFAQEFLWFRRLLWVAKKTLRHTCLSTWRLSSGIPMVSVSVAGCQGYLSNTHVCRHGGFRSGIPTVSASVVGCQANIPRMYVSRHGGFR